VRGSRRRCNEVEIVVEAAHPAIGISRAAIHVTANGRSLREMKTVTGAIEDAARTIQTGGSHYRPPVSSRLTRSLTKLMGGCLLVEGLASKTRGGTTSRIVRTLDELIGPMSDQGHHVVVKVNRLARHCVPKTETEIVEVKTIWHTNIAWQPELIV
jgi:hypothetical protein